MSLSIPLLIWLLLAPPLAEVHRARELARAGQAAEALAALARAAAGGFGGLAMVDGDPNLAPVRALPGWAEVRAAVDRNMRPCSYTLEYRQLDFWVGEWEVRSSTAPPGLPPATSRIELVEDQCVIAEYYTNASGYSGRSLNVYDRDTKRWEQFWVDNKGGRHHYVGHGRDGNLYYEAESVRFDGPGTPPGKVKMTFFAQGKNEVRQLIEQSRDGGKTWAVVFDGIYRRRNRGRVPWPPVARSSPTGRTWRPRTLERPAFEPLRRLAVQDRAARRAPRDGRRMPDHARPFGRAGRAGGLRACGTATG